MRKRRTGWPDRQTAASLGDTAQEVARTYGAFQPGADDPGADNSVYRGGERRRAQKRGE